MKVLAFNGSPRKRGNTEALLAAVLRGVEQAGGRTESIRLCELSIQPCIGCGGCDTTGKCVVDDDMTGLYEKIRAAKRVILASPIYFYNITAQAKAFVDRTQALWSWKRLMAEKGEWREETERKGFFVSVAATRGARVFEGAILTMKYAFDAMGMAYGGDFLVKGIDRRGEMAEAVEKLKEAEAFGRKCLL
jgi:multimeric flavodoxin WrbA